MHFQHFKLSHQFVNKMLRSSSNRGNWCCLTRKLFEFTAYLEILVMYHEGGRIRCILKSPGQTGRLGRSVYIEASWLNLPIFFSTFLQHEKVYSDDRFLVKVRSYGHFLVSAKSVT